MAKRAVLSNFLKAVAGISVEILATFTMMAVIFAVGFLILKLFTKG